MRSRLANTTFKVNFTLDEQDVAYFRRLFKQARSAAKRKSPDEVIAGARELVVSVSRDRKAPRFVQEAVLALEDLADMIEDTAYRAPKVVVSQILGALAYFAEPEDLIPDHVPVLGFLDDAIMIKFVEREFKHELAAYRRFKRFREGAEQRPWTAVAKERLPQRLEEKRKALRAEVDRKKKADEEKGRAGF